MYKIALIEDDPLFREEITHLITEDCECQLVASAGCMSEAHRLLSKHFDGVLLDIQLPDGSGLDLIPAIQQAVPEAKILVTTVHHNRESVITALRRGAHGYVLKDDEQLLTQLKAACDGHMPLDARVTQHLIAQVQDSSAKPKTAHLTPREQQTLAALACGLSYMEIADRLTVSVHTIPGYIKGIYRKLKVNSRSQAVYVGAQQGLVELKS